MSLIKALNHRLLQCCLIIITTIIIIRSLWWHSKHWGHLDVLTPCSSSLSSCSGTLGELRASLRHWILSSGMTYSSTSFSGRPRAVPCLAVDGMASSRMAPRSVVSWQKTQMVKFHPVNCLSCVLWGPDVPLYSVTCVCTISMKVKMSVNQSFYSFGSHCPHFAWVIIFYFKLLDIYTH